MAECRSLLNSRAAMLREFESRPLRLLTSSASVIIWCMGEFNGNNSGPVLETLQQQELAAGSQEAYLKLIGLSTYPESPRDLPSSFSVPAELTSQLEEVLLVSLGDNRERSQLVYWTNKEQKYKPGKVWKGARSASGALSTINNFTKTTRFTDNKVLVDFHTHPEYRLSLFSDADIANALAAPSPAHMHLVGSKGGIFALLSTTDSQFHPLSRTVDVIRNKRRLGKKGYSTLGTLEEAASVLESEGFGLFVWKTPSHIVGIEKGDMKNGIVLEKVKT